MDYQLEKTPNSRLLYAKCQGGARDWEDRLQLVDGSLEELPHFQIASNAVYFYFFCSSSEKQFENLEAWVGRQVVGLPHKMPVSCDLAHYDLERGECISLVLPREDLNFDSIWGHEQKLRQKLEGKFSLAPTWRLKWQLQNGKNNIWTQFFTG